MVVMLQERKNFFEEEIARLKIPRSIINARTGVPEADMMLDASYGEYITNYVVPRMQTDIYKNLDNDKQELFIRDLISNYKSDIKEAVEENAKQTADARFGFNPFELVEFNRFQPSGFKDMAIQLYEERFGSDQPKDYELLLKIAKKLKERRKYAKYIGADDFFATK